jgi:hypothetical protein
LEILAFRQTSPIGVPSSACFKTKAICASVNFDTFMELSLFRLRDHKWKIPAQNGPICWGLVSTNPSTSEFPVEPWVVPPA